MTLASKVVLRIQKHARKLNASKSLSPQLIGVLSTIVIGVVGYFCLASSLSRFHFGRYTVYCFAFFAWVWFAFLRIPAKPVRHSDLCRATVPVDAGPVSEAV